MLARVENGRAKTLAENSPVNIAALVDFIEYTLDDIKGSISHRQHPLPGQWPSSIIHEQEGKGKEQQNVQHRRPQDRDRRDRHRTAKRGGAAAGGGQPPQPVPGAAGEQQFFEAAQSVRSYDLVLNLLEREVKREARKRAGRTAQSAAVFLITAGLIILATLGFAAALLLMRCPVPAVSVTAFIGVAVSLGWAVIRK